MLDGYADTPSPFAPGRPARRWMAMNLSSDSGQSIAPRNLVGRLRLSPTFAQAVYDQLAPGAVLMMTDQPADHDTRPDRGFVIMTSPQVAVARP
jgi:hypothetical protein